MSVHPFIEVPWEFARSEGEGHSTVDEWRAGHRRYWAAHGTPVQDDTPVVCVSFVVLSGAPASSLPHARRSGQPT